jgi:L-alanine-DL-glutamate epimerase and related enzymes of enolase superfamily
MKVGGGIDFDHKRMAFLRQSIGDEALLMTDANQIWGVDEAIEYMKRLSEFRP